MGIFDYDQIPDQDFFKECWMRWDDVALIKSPDSVLLYFHVERTTAENSYEPDLDTGISFLAAATLPLYQEGVPPPICTKVTPPTSGQQEEGGGYHAFKKAVGGQGTSHFWERGVPPCKKRGSYPTKPSTGKISLQTTTPREAQVLEMSERGGRPPLMPG